MNELIEVQIVLEKRKYPKIYNSGLYIIIILIIFIFVACFYNYKTYYVANSKIVNNKLELLVKIDDLKYVINNNFLITNDKVYKYEITNISNEIFIDESYENYKYIYLNVYNLCNIDNYVYEVKIIKDNKKLIKYLKDYI